jgi:hypothetical protein
MFHPVGPHCCFDGSITHATGPHDSFLHTIASDDNCTYSVEGPWIEILPLIIRLIHRFCLGFCQTGDQWPSPNYAKPSQKQIIPGRRARPVSSRSKSCKSSISRLALQAGFFGQALEGPLCCPFSYSTRIRAGGQVIAVPTATCNSTDLQSAPAALLITMSVPS